MRIAIIPARGGSARIPRKNVKDFAGKPMLAWPIGVLKASGLFDRIVVSTDDMSIARIAEAEGAEVPFMRPNELAGPDAPTDAVVEHAVRACLARYGSFTHGCCVYPTTPMLAIGDLERGLALLDAHRATSAFPVVRYDFPIEQAFTLDGVRPRAVSPDKLLARSQDLPEHVHDAGLFYWFDVEKFLDTPQLFSTDSVAFTISADRCQDINTPDDWVSAERKFRIMRAESEAP